MPRRSKGYTARLNLALTPEQFEQLNNHADTHDMSVSEIVRRALRNYLPTEETDDPQH